MLHSRRVLLIALTVLVMVGGVSAEYTLVGSWGRNGGDGSPGAGGGEFDRPMGVAVNTTGFIYVADTGNDRIQVLSPSGAFVAAFGSSGSANGQFKGPMGIAVNSTGHVWVADTGNDRVSLFSPVGTWIRSWTGWVGGFKAPRGVTVDAGDTVYVTDTRNNRVQLLTKNEVSSGAWYWFSDPHGIDVAPSGQVFVTMRTDDQVEVRTSGNDHVMTWGKFGWKPNEFDNPHGVEVSPDGTRVFICDFGNNRVSVFDPAGTPLAQWGRVPGGTNYPFRRPADIATTADGTVFVVESEGNRVLLFRDLPLPTPLTAGFTAYPQTGPAPLEVQFTDTSTRAITWLWDFGDGATSREKNPVHVYTNPGTYSVALLVTDGVGGTASTMSSELVRVRGPPPTADFSANRTSGAVSLAVAFEANTTVATSWQWYFGDGTTSNERNPVHVYTRPGRYTVWLVASAAGYGSVIARKDAFIAVVDTITVDFEANVTTGAAPLAIGFEGRSNGTPFFWHWAFGDGLSSNGQTATHVYAASGTYGVTLTVWTANGSVSTTKTGYITVDGDPRVPEANFTLSRTSGQAPLYVRFTDTSTGNPTSWRWDFGGLAWTTMRNPSVVFRQPGEYPVTLTVRNPFGFTSMVTNVTVTGAEGMGRTVGGRSISVVG